MSNTHGSSTQPVYSSRAPVTRVAIALVSVAISATLLGGVLALFETQSSDAALARASAPATTASNALAVRDTQLPDAELKGA